MSASCSHVNIPNHDNNNNDNIVTELNTVVVDDVQQEQQLVEEIQEDQEGGIPKDVEDAVVTNNNNPNDTIVPVTKGIVVVASLASTYGKRPSRLLLLSLLINIALLIYAHCGLSAVVLSNIERVQEESEEQQNDDTTTKPPPTGNIPSNTTSGACTVNESDLDRWYNQNGSINKPIEGSYCGKQYNGNGCLLNADCTTECFHTQFNYTMDCATCFSTIPLCSLNDGCAVVCQQNNGQNIECQTCTVACNEEFLQCSGFQFVSIPNYTSVDDNNSTTNNSTNTINEYSTNEEICAIQQMNVSYIDDVTEYYIVYELKFFAAVQRAWTSNAKLLAIIVIVFSGIWPYMKNIIMCIVWYISLQTNHNNNNNNDSNDDNNDTNNEEANKMTLLYHQRHTILLWLKRLGKWSFVDVYIIIVIMIGLTIEISLSNNTIALVLKGEPRPAIVAFLVATIFSFIHLEVITEYHIHQYHTYLQSQQQKNVLHNNNNNKEQQQEQVDADREEEENEHHVSIVNRTTTTNLYDAFYVHPCNGRCCRKNNNTHDNTDDVRGYKKFRNPLIGKLLLFILYSATITLFIIGSTYDVIHFVSYVTDTSSTAAATTNTTMNESQNVEPPGCIHAYNIYTLGTMMISNFVIHDNNALPGVYTLFISYILFVIVGHLLVQCVQLVSLLFNNHHMSYQKYICRFADYIWTFASVEVLLLGLFSVQYKFEELVAALAGSDGAQFFGMRAELREGFFILIVYSVFAGICQYLFQSTVAEYYQIHSFQKVRNIFGWASLCPCVWSNEVE